MTYQQLAGWMEQQGYEMLRRVPASACSAPHELWQLKRAPWECAIVWTGPAAQAEARVTVNNVDRTLIPAAAFPAPGPASPEQR